MTGKVLLLVRLPSTGRTYEMRVSWDLTVCQATGLVSSILADRERGRHLPRSDEAFMLIEGEEAGMLLDGDALIRDFVSDGTIADGSAVALV